jgi:hypothetical protein
MISLVCGSKCVEAFRRDKDVQKVAGSGRHLRHIDLSRLRLRSGVQHNAARIGHGRMQTKRIKGFALSQCAIRYHEHDTRSPNSI